MLNSDALSQLKQIRQDLRESRNQFEATVRGSQGRFGFATLDDGRDAFLNPEQMGKVLPGDRVLVEIQEDDKGRINGKVAELLKSNVQFLTGKTVNKGPALFVESDMPGLQRWLFVPPKQRKGVKDAEVYVLAKLQKHPFKDGKPQVEIVKVIGTADKPGLATDYSLSKHNLVLRDKLTMEVAVLEKILQDESGKRTDLREVPFITIDAPSTRDIDDALFCEPSEQGWRLRVAIADPGAFVEAGSPLDQLALKRAQTLYFPDRIINMLPSVIANEWASLLPSRDRLALVCDLTLSAEGEILDYQLQEAVIRVAERLDYDSASKRLQDSGDQSFEAFRQCLPALQKWRSQNLSGGSQRDEYRLELDDRKQVKAANRLENTAAHELVELTMIAANHCAARFLAEHQAGLFVGHAGFRPERLQQIRQVITEQVPDLSTQSLESLDGFRQTFQHLNQLTHELPLLAIASRLLIRGQISLQPEPHFGMGLPLYTTFTSPIRRYVDLHVHHCIKAILNGRKAPDLSDSQVSNLQDKVLAGRQAVQEAERWLISRFAESRVGQTSAAKIVQTNGSGFVAKTLDDGIEGFVNLAELPEKYRFDATYFQHVGEERAFRLDQTVQVVIQETDPKRQSVIFSLA